MDRKSSTNEQSDEDYDYLAFDVERNPAGLRVETSRDNVWTFRHDVEAWNEGEEVWIPDLEDTPSVIISALEYRGYEIRE